MSGLGAISVTTVEFSWTYIVDKIGLHNSLAFVFVFFIL